MRTCNSTCNSTTAPLPCTGDIFQEAISHCRWKTILHNKVLPEINILQFENKTFNEIMCEIYGICYCIKGIGMLTMYDITAAICRYFKLSIDKVYIVGKGPKRAVKLLNLKTKIHKINDTIKMKYVELNDIILAFDMHGFVMDRSIRTTTNGDILETYICNWQKTQ